MITPSSESVKEKGLESDTKKTGRKRPRAPPIDLDEHIKEAQKAMKAAQKEVQKAKNHAKYERRKKARLMAKASKLNSADLERIATLKRCGLWAPGLGEPKNIPSASASASSSTDGPHPAVAQAHTACQAVEEEAGANGSGHPHVASTTTGCNKNEETSDIASKSKETTPTTLDVLQVAHSEPIHESPAASVDELEEDSAS